MNTMRRHIMCFSIFPQARIDDGLTRTLTLLIPFADECKSLTKALQRILMDIGALATDTQGSLRVKGSFTCMSMKRVQANVACSRRVRY